MEYVFQNGYSIDTSVSCSRSCTIHQIHYNARRIHCRMHVLSGRDGMHTTIHAEYIRNTPESCILCRDTSRYICIARVRCMGGAWLTPFRPPSASFASKGSIPFSFKCWTSLRVMATWTLPARPPCAHVGSHGHGLLLLIGEW